MCRTIRKIIHAALMACVMACIPLQFVACDGLDDIYSTGQLSSYTGQYVGTWNVDGQSPVDAEAVVYGDSIHFSSLPCKEIVQGLYPDAMVAEASAVRSCQRLGYSMTSTSDGAVLYLMMPESWSISANVDGRQRDINIWFCMNAAQQDKVSWGTLSRNNILTVILHATSFSVDGGAQQPMELKLTYKARRQY